MDRIALARELVKLAKKLTEEQEKVLMDLARSHLESLHGAKIISVEAASKHSYRVKFSYRGETRTQLVDARPYEFAVKGSSTMNRIVIASEILKIAKELMAIEFDTDAEKKKYQQEHEVRPGTKLTVKKSETKGENPSLSTRQRDLWWKIDDATKKQQNGKQIHELSGIKQKVIQEEFERHHKGKKVNWSNVWNGVNAWKKDPKTVRDGYTRHEYHNKISDLVEKNAG